MTKGPVDGANTVKDRLVEGVAPPPVASIDTVLVPSVAVGVAENETVAMHVGSQGLFLKVAVTPLGSPEAERLTGPVVPETKVAVTDEDALAEPWTTVRPPGDGVERLKSKAGGAAMVQRTACVAPEVVSLEPTICPKSLMLQAKLIVPLGSVPRSVIVPFCQKTAWPTAPEVVKLTPTICPKSLMPVASLKAPRSVIVPFCQRKAWKTKGVVDSLRLTPTICPKSLIPEAELTVPPGRVPRSVIVPFCQRKAR